MTCVLGYKGGGYIVLGGDSAVTADTLRSLSDRPKVFKSGKFVFGYAGSIRSGQLLESLACNTKFKSKLKTVPKDAFFFLVEVFVPALRKHLKSSGDLGADENRDLGSVFIVGVGNRLFRIDMDFQVVEPKDPYTAIGSAESLVMGVFRSVEIQSEGWAYETNPTPEHIVSLALDVACYHDSGCAGPFHFVSTKE